MDYERKYNELVEAARIVVEGNPGLCKTDEGLGRLSKLLPEKESEDERIMKRIRLCLDECVHSDIIRDYERDECLAYLEKQKDAIGAARQQGYEEGLEDGIKMNMAEQMGESKEWADELSAEIDRISKRYPEVSFAKLSRVAVHFVRWQKDYSKVVEFDHDRKPTNSEKPKEWSEEDKGILLSVKCVIDEVWHNKNNSTDCPVNELEEMWNWLNTIWERVEYPQPHWKPREEELVTLKRVGVILRNCGHSELAKEVFMIEGKLANLPVANKSTWKPREEQMEAMETIINSTHNPNHDICILRELYNDLKKL